jgi:hypothetical protein
VGMLVISVVLAVIIRRKIAESPPP